MSTYFDHQARVTGADKPRELVSVAHNDPVAETIRAAITAKHTGIQVEHGHWCSTCHQPWETCPCP